MNIQIISKHLDLTLSLKKFIEDKLTSLDKFLSRFEAQGEILIKVEIARITNHHKHGDVYSAKATMDLPGKRLYSERNNDDLRKAVDELKDVLKKEIVSYKEKTIDQRRK